MKLQTNESNDQPTDSAFLGPSFAASQGRPWMGLDGLEWALVGALDGAFTIGVADELMDHTAIVCKASSQLRLVSLFFSFSLCLFPPGFSFLVRSWIKMQVRELRCFRPMRRAVWPLKLHARNASRLEITSCHCCQRNSQSTPREFQRPAPLSIPISISI
jgi:hypothetical protein